MKSLFLFVNLRSHVDFCILFQNDSVFAEIASLSLCRTHSINVVIKSALLTDYFTGWLLWATYFNDKPVLLCSQHWATFNCTIYIYRNCFFKFKEGRSSREYKTVLIKEHCRLDMSRYTFPQRMINELYPL